MAGSVFNEHEPRVRVMFGAVKPRQGKVTQALNKVMQGHNGVGGANDKRPLFRPQTFTMVVYSIHRSIPASLPIRSGMPRSLHALMGTISALRAAQMNWLPA